MKLLKYLALAIVVVAYGCSGNSEKLENGFVVIKTCTGKYVGLVSDTTDTTGIRNKLVGCITDSSLAERFYMEYSPEGFVTLKASNNLYVCADYNIGGFLVADRKKASDWEKVILENLDSNKYAMKSADGKYVCEDQSINNTLIANREKASDWEIFIFEKK